MYVSEGWCTNCGLVKSCCSEAIELMRAKCRPYYLHRQFTAVFIPIVYIPPIANGNEASKELHDTIILLQMTHPQVFYMVAGDFNHVKLMDSLPSFYQFLPHTLWTVCTLTFTVRTELFLAPILSSPTTSPSCWRQHVVH